MKNFWQDCKLGFALLKREGIKKFLKRGIWYLRGSRLNEDIWQKKGIESKFNWIIKDLEKNKLTNPPLLSVVIPAYNHEKYITKALESVINQTYSNLEIIVVDDGSTDNTFKIAKEVLAKSDRSYKVFTQKNTGAPNTINWGIKQTKGKYVTILNSDDFYAENRFEVLITELENQQATLAFSGVNWVDDKNDIINKNLLAGQFELKQKYAEQFPTCGFAILASNIAISSGNFVFTKELYDKIDGFKQLHFCHDWDFLCESLRFGEPLFIAEKLYYYRFHGDNTFLKLQKILPDEHRQLLKNILNTKDFISPEFPCAEKWRDYMKEFILTHDYKKYLE